MNGDNFEKARQNIKDCARIMGLMMVSSIILDIIGNLDGKYVFDFSKYRMSDLKYHWHEMLEQVIMERFEE